MYVVSLLIAELYVKHRGTPKTCSSESVPCVQLLGATYPYLQAIYTPKFY